MPRNRFSFPRRRPPRRDAHPTGFDSNCVRLTPPIEHAEGFFIGFCGDLQLWRVRLPGFDRYGVTDEAEDMADFRAAILDGADSIRDREPELAARLVGISEAIESD